MRKRARPSLTEFSGCGHFWTEIRSPRMRARCRLHAYTIERYKVGARKKASHVVADLRRAAGDVYDQRSGTTNERGCATYTRTKLRAECRFSWYVQHLCFQVSPRRSIAQERGGAGRCAFKEGEQWA